MKLAEYETQVAELEQQGTFEAASHLSDLSREIRLCVWSQHCRQAARELARRADDAAMRIARVQRQPLFVGTDATGRTSYVVP